MLVTERSKGDMRELEMNDARRDVGSTRTLGDDELGEVCAIRTNRDVLLKRNNIHREVEGERERGGGVVAAHGRIEGGRLGEAEVKLVQADGLDDIEHTTVGEDGLNNERLDTLVEPSNLRDNNVSWMPCQALHGYAYVCWTSAVTVNLNVAILTMDEGAEHLGHSSETSLRALGDEATGKREMDSRERREAERLCR